MANKAKVVMVKMTTTTAVPITASPVSIEKSADLEMDGREDFQNSLCFVGGGIEADTVAERLSVTPAFEDVGTTRKPKKAAEASADAAYPLGEPTTLCSRRMKVS